MSNEAHSTGIHLSGLHSLDVLPPKKDRSDSHGHQLVVVAISSTSALNDMSLQVEEGELMRLDR